MIFERAIRREFAQAAAGISVALLAIMTSVQLIRLLKDAAGGRLAPEGVITLLGFGALKFLPMLLTLTLFVAILLSLSRLYRDSEMVVWLSSGLPLTAWVKPVMLFAAPIVIAIAALAVSLTPWANRAQEDYRGVLAARSELSRLSPGAFKEVGNGQRVFFVEEIPGEQERVGNVFVANIQDGKLGVVMSDAGYLATLDDGQRAVVLENGRRYEVVPGSAAFKIMSFERYQVLTEEREVKPGSNSPKRMTLPELLEAKGNGARAELLWRIAIPVSAVILALLAIPLSYVNPRAGRSANMLIAILVYAIYSNLISVTQAWVGRGQLPFSVAVWAPHVLMLLPLIFLFRQRMVLRSPFRRKEK